MQILAYPDGLDGTMDQIPRPLGEFDSFGGEGGSSWRDFISFRLDPAVVQPLGSFLDEMAHHSHSGCEFHRY